MIQTASLHLKNCALSGAPVARLHFGCTGPWCTECGRETPDLKAVEVMMCTLKALALTPLVLRKLLLALKDVSLAGSMGSLTSLFSARDNTSSRVSLEKAPSSISEIRFPVRSILFRVTVEWWGKDLLLQLYSLWMFCTPTLTLIRFQPASEFVSLHLTNVLTCRFEPSVLV